MFERFLSRLTELSDLKLFVVRYFVNLVVFLEILLLPIIFDPSFFSEVEILRQLYMLAPVLILGAHSGYLLLYYKKNQDFRIELVAWCLINGLLGSILVYWFIGSWVAALALCFFLVVMALEKLLIVENQLVIASTYKSFMSITALILAVAVSIYDLPLSALNFYALSTIVGIAVWLIYVFLSLKGRFRRFMVPTIEDAKSLFNAGFKLVQSGFMLSFQSYLLLIYLIYDRRYINAHFSNDVIAEYSIAFSLCQIVFIAVNTIAFSNQRKFGEDYRSTNLAAYNRYLKTSMVFFFLLAALSVPCVYIFSFLVSGYGDFLKSYLILVAILGVFYVFSTLSIIAYYQGKSRYMVAAYAFALALNIVVSEVASDISYYAHIVQSSLILVFGVLLIDRLIRRGFQPVNTVAAE